MCDRLGVSAGVVVGPRDGGVVDGRERIELLGPLQLGDCVVDTIHRRQEQPITTATTGRFRIELERAAKLPLGRDEVPPIEELGPPQYGVGLCEHGIQLQGTKGGGLSLRKGICR